MECPCRTFRVHYLRHQKASALPQPADLRPRARSYDAMCSKAGFAMGARSVGSKVHAGQTPRRLAERSIRGVQSLGTAANLPPDAVPRWARTAITHTRKENAAMRSIARVTVGIGARSRPPSGAKPIGSGGGFLKEIRPVSRGAIE